MGINDQGKGIQNARGGGRESNSETRSGTDRHGEEKNAREQAREVVGKNRPMLIRTKNWKRKKPALGYGREMEDEKKEGEGEEQRHLEKKGELEEDTTRGSVSRREEGEQR